MIAGIDVKRNIEVFLDTREIEIMEDISEKKGRRWFQDFDMRFVDDSYINGVIINRLNPMTQEPLVLRVDPHFIAEVNANYKNKLYNWWTREIEDGIEIIVERFSSSRGREYIEQIKKGRHRNRITFYDIEELEKGPRNRLEYLEYYERVKYRQELKQGAKTISSR